MGVSAPTSGNLSVLGRREDSLGIELLEVLFTLAPAACLMPLRRRAQHLARQLAAQAGLSLVALGGGLVRCDQRVDRALTSILSSKPWDVHQRKWLKRIAEQMKANTVVDRDALDSGRFAESGGFNRLNKLFDGKLDAVLGELAEDVWKEQA